MANHKKHRNSHKKKLMKRIAWGAVAVVVLLLAGVWAWKSPLVQSRVQASFGNNAAYQKKEYDHQRAIAKKKYGKQASSAVSAKKTTTEEKQDSSSEQASENSTASSTSSSAHKTDSGKYTYITVESGEYLSTIASEYGTTVDELMELNDLDSREISAGARLKVPSDGNSTASSSAASDSSTTDGDTAAQDQ
ncbi:LysM-domain protein/autolysin [Ligilactobacillus salitolerans]|uniref:LysM-domain protein/autolysin n=1 Tax=Ligilactobacillus salitolerans TaxID=1808352 RepID=A0A401IVA5_9LACO|nr:LysM peptidoglycan-binding domain-containing protein [Ligilactobacillus salitolerans]GBG95435.1 LysM-domain protein/autolysin [Ligilactobacillus salitolerans]